MQSLTDLLSEARAYATLHDFDLAVYQEGAQHGNFSVYLNCNDENLSEFAWSAFRRMKRPNQRNFVSEVNRSISGSGDRLMSIETHKKVMEKLNQNAQRARDVAAKKHKEELEALMKDVADAEAQTLEYADHYNEARRRGNTWLAASCLFMFLAAVGLSCTFIMASRVRTVHTEPPPALTKIHVPVEAYLDAKGTYRNYSNGETLDPQPKQWELP